MTNNNDLGIGTHSSGGDIHFFAGNDGVFADTKIRMSILDNGNVGIGVTNPGVKLQVQTTGASGTDGLRIRNDTDSHYVDIRPSMSVGANNGIVQAGDTGIIYTNGSINTGGFALAP